MSSKINHDKKYFTVFTTGFGWCGVVFTLRGVQRIFLPEKKRAYLDKRIQDAFPDAVTDTETFSGLCSELISYFRGSAPRFDCRLDMRRATAFQRNVWNAARKIPYGEVTTYGGIAAQLHRPRAARAVGTALGRNPFPIVVPCHRVLPAAGGLGGFSGPDGAAYKKRLLRLEGSLGRQPSAA